ncbi:MAG TPA: hypothetical protein VMA75_00325 [Candidatus Paceibacterota bacterium]|nr:hypothetical protein [Candidatus Paceibacterota bacterium]
MPRLAFELFFWAVMWVAFGALLNGSLKLERILAAIILRPLGIAAFAFVATIGLGGVSMMYADDSKLVSVYLFAVFIGAASGAIALIVSIVQMCRKRPVPAAQ